MPNQDNDAISSSLLTYPVSIALLLTACMAAAFTEKTVLAAFFGCIFVMSLCANVWGRFSVHNLTYSLEISSAGVFPGQAVRFTRTLYNQKLLPLIWAEIIEPRALNGCAAPGGPDNQYQNAYKFSLLKWYQKLNFTDEWTASRRGVHLIETVKIRSGDGFGLCVRSQTVALKPARRVFVYPQLVDVSIEKVMRDMWDTRSAAYGYLEDITLLRSVRGYLPSDPAKRINRRLLAGGQGLMVNQYETVTPNTVLFILDAASFNGRDPQHLESTLSIMASLLAGLCNHGIQAGLAAPASAYFPETLMQPSGGKESLLRMLELLAAVGHDNPVSCAPLQIQSPESIGQAFYFAHNLDDSTSLGLLAPFPVHKIRLLFWHMDDSAEKSGFRSCAVQSYRRAI